MSTTVSLVAYGLVLAAIYLLLAEGLVLVFSIIEIPNFAQAGFYMVGGYASYVSYTVLHVSAVVTLPIAFVVTGLLGALLWYGIFQRQMSHPRADMFVSAFGVLVVLQSGCALLFGPESDGYPLAPGDSHQVFGLIPDGQVWIVAITVLIGVALWLFIDRTMLGRAMRAVAQNRFAADALGMNAPRIALIALVVGSGLGGAAGSLLGGLTGVDPSTGGALLLQIFAIVVVGGMGSLRGAAVAAVAMGIGQSFLGFYASEYTDLLFFLSMFATLLIRPQGIFGGAHSGAVEAA
jgi:branched-chain amino acid transport system permease protein